MTVFAGADSREDGWAGEGDHGKSFQEDEQVPHAPDLQQVGLEIFFFYVSLYLEFTIFTWLLLDAYLPEQRAETQVASCRAESCGAASLILILSNLLRLPLSLKRSNFISAIIIIFSLKYLVFCRTLSQTTQIMKNRNSLWHFQSSSRRFRGCFTCCDVPNTGIVRLIPNLSFLVNLCL